MKAMKFVLFTLCTLLAFYLPSISSAQEQDACSGVSCSGHGKCVVRNGEPVCACHEGYTVDQRTGVNCNPIEESSEVEHHLEQTDPVENDASEPMAPMEDPPEEASVLEATGTPQPPLMSGPETTELSSVHGSCQYDGHCSGLRVCHEGVCMSRHNKRTAIREGENLIIAGRALLITSLVVVLQGAAFAIVDMGIWLGLVAGAGGGTLFAIGLPMLVSGKRKKHRIQYGEKPVDVILGQLFSVTPTISIGSNGGTVGVAVQL